MTTSDPQSDARIRYPLSHDGTDILTVLWEKQVYCVFQPIVDLQRQRIFAYESLARSKIAAFPSPIDLFAAAVEHRCTGELGRLLRQQSIDGCPSAPLFINIHPSELNEEFLIQPDDPIFKHTHDVYLEITESVPLSHFSLCQSMLQEMRGRGVHLVVDDLGAGYSNLKYIADLHPKIVKIDRGLIDGLRIGTRMFKLVTSIVNMCKDLDCLVVAEGIETREELEAVIASGARYAQGYFLARPAPLLPQAMWPARDGEAQEVLQAPRPKKHQTLRRSPSE
jgi:EAL domain-containing protein (putative c-di-GMP-specific phosphodiesterase class I)